MLKWNIVGLICALLLSLPPAVSAEQRTGLIEQWSHRGVEVHFLPARQIPIVDIRLWFRAGSAYNPANGALASLTSNMLGVGTAGLEEAELDHKLGLLGAHLDTSLNRDGAWLDLRSLSDKSKPALELLNEVISSPRWGKKPFELLKERKRLAVQRQLRDARQRLALETFQLVYGQHPYARPVGGQLDDIDQATLDQVKKYYRKYYTVRNMKVLVVGDTKRADIDGWLDNLIDKMTEGESAPEIAWIKKTPLPSRKHIEFDDTQAHWNAVSLGVARASPDYPFSVLAMFILDKRIDKGLRDEYGLTYDAGAYAIKLIGRGILKTYLVTRAEHARSTIKLANKIKQGFISKGVSKDEFVRARKHLAGVLSISYSSNASLLGLLQIIATEQLPLDYLPRLIKEIEGMDLKAFNNFIHRYFSHRRFSEVSVGSLGESDADTSDKTELP